MFWSTAVAVAYLGVVGAIVRVEVYRPAPCMPATDSRCSCKYQAVLDELLTFEAVALTDQAIAMNFGILEKDSKVLVKGCHTEECPRNITCHHFCQSSEAITSTVGYKLYDFCASPYNQRIGDTIKTICIEVNHSMSLRFVAHPGPSVSTTDGNVTLSYVAHGYPEPEAYTLICEGLEIQQNKRGIFHVGGHQNGLLNCYAEAINRLSRARSRTTQISVAKSPDIRKGSEKASVDPNPETLPHQPASASLQLPISKDQEIPLIVSGVVVVGLVIVIAIVMRMHLLRHRRNREKVTPSIINIVNDNSQHTTVIHNGNKVESYGPGSVIACHSSDSADTPMLQSHNSSSEQCYHVCPDGVADVGSYDGGASAY